MLGEETYSEVYTAIADLDDGTYALLQLLFTNAGLGDGKATCRALVVEKGDKGINHFVDMDRDEWSYDPTGDALSAGPCVLEKSQTGIAFHAVINGMSLRIGFDGSPRVRKPPHSRIVDGSSFHQTEIFLPWASVTATWQLPGKAQKTSVGMGYLDHVRSNMLVKHTAKQWIRFRGYQGGDPVLLQLRYLPKGGIEGWVWRRGQPAAVSVDPASVQTRVSSEGLEVIVSDGAGQFTLRSGSTLFRYRPVEQHPYGKFMKPVLGNPETITYRSSADFGEGGELRGTMEVSSFD